jgi:predicted ribosome quality control (RQC) complex YloA/Tae2 family protein
VGKNSRQNEEVTFRRAAPNDLWLHVRGAPGAHVIVKTGGREVPEATLRQAAQLAAYYSQVQGSARVAVDYTERRHVRPIKGAGPGLVTYTQEKTIQVVPKSRE